MECELGSIKGQGTMSNHDMTQHAHYVQHAHFCTLATVVIGLSAVPSDHVKSKLYIKGVRLFMGGELTTSGD